MKLAQALLFKFKRIRDQAEDVEKIVYRLQGGRAQNSAARGRARGRRRSRNVAIERRSSVQDGFDGPSRRGDVEMTSRVSYGGNGPDSAAAVTARALPRPNAVF